MDIHKSLSRAGEMTMLPARISKAILRGLLPLWWFPIIGLICPAILQGALFMSGFGEINYYPRLDDLNHSVINQQRLRLNISGKKNSFQFKLWSEARRNGNGGYRPEWELILSEAFGEYHGESFFLRLGKQQIVWGAADGLFINDIVNPLDLSEFLLPDLENVRLGQPSARLQWRRGNWLVEGVWIWRFAETRLPGIMKASGGALTANGLNIPLLVLDPRKPAYTLGNSETGWRVSGLVGQWDLSINFLRSWRDIPTYRGKMVLMEQSGIPAVEIMPFYQRISTWGGSFSRPLGSLLLRGEFSFIPNLQIETDNPVSSPPVVTRDFLTYFLGADFQIKKTRLGIQFAQEIISGNTDLLNRKKLDNVLTLMLERTFFRESLHCLLFADKEFDQHDLWVRAEFGYRISDRCKVTLGTHVFNGRENGRLGRFHDLSSISLKMRYSFSA